MQLEQVVPWGRNLDEYKAMGLYTKADRNKKILGCGDGPASVNAELTLMGVAITSIDPIYQFTKEQIAQRVVQTSKVIAQQLRENQNDFVWKNIADVDELVAIRLQAMEVFLEDYDQGKKTQRYQYEELPNLHFEDDTFDLAWSSHFLFLYSEHLDEEFHIKAIEEMLRVAKEVRIFPLVDLNNTTSPHLNPVVTYLEKKGYRCQREKTAYEFQKGAFEMLRIVR